MYTKLFSPKTKLSCSKFQLLVETVPYIYVDKLKQIFLNMAQLNLTQISLAFWLVEPRLLPKSECFPRRDSKGTFYKLTLSFDSSTIEFVRNRYLSPFPSHLEHLAD